MKGTVFAKPAIVSQILAVIFYFTGCHVMSSGQEELDSSSEEPDSSTEERDSSQQGTGGRDSDTDARPDSTPNGGTNNDNPSPIAVCPGTGFDEYTDAGVNLYIYNYYGDTTFPILAFQLFCFTKGVDCERYTIDLRLRLDSASLKQDVIELPGSRFRFSNEETLSSDAYAEFLGQPDSKLEIKGASMVYVYTPCCCSSTGYYQVPHIYLEGSLDMVKFVRGEQTELPDYVILKDEEGNVVYESIGLCGGYYICDDAGVSNAGTPGAGST